MKTLTLLALFCLLQVFCFADEDLGIVDVDDEMIQDEFEDMDRAGSPQDELEDMDRSGQPKAYGDAVDTLCGKFTHKKVVVKGNTIGTFTVQKRTKRCVAHYTIGGGCKLMKLTCSTFFVDNRDRARCRKGDRFLVKVPQSKQPMRYCKNHKPTDRFPVLSSSTMKVWYHAHTDQKYKSKAISCQVECFRKS